MKGATRSRDTSHPFTAPSSHAGGERNRHHEPRVHEDHAPERWQDEASADQAAGNHAAEADDRAHGQVDAAAQDDKRHADREDRVDGHVLDQDRQVAGRQELRREHREGDRQHDERDEGAELQDEREP